MHSQKALECIFLNYAYHVHLNETGIWPLIISYDYAQLFKIVEHQPTRQDTL